jgi:hypothetical protein
MPPEFDEHILSTMTDEERAAILEEQSPEELAAIAAIASGAENGPDDEDDELDDDNGAADPAAAVVTPVTPAAKAEPAAPVAADTTEVADKAFQPSYQAALPEDFDAQVAAVKAQTDALADKFKSGEIDFDQYRIEAEALSKSSRALDELSFKANLAQDMKAQTVEQEWAHTVSRFMVATAKVDGIDYKNDADKNADLDMFVKALANDPRHADMPGEWFLTEGHKRVKAMHGIGLAAAPAPAAADPKASRKTPLDAAPKTLAQVPGGDGPGDVDGNEFSDVDRLTGDAQEAAIAKMTPAQRERYMAGV